MDINLIAHIRRYVPLDEQEAEKLLSWLKPKQLKKKEFLLEEGQSCSANFFVEKGCLRMFFIKENGTEQIIQFAIENWWLSDYMSLGTQVPSRFYIQAIEDTQVLALESQHEKELFKELPQLDRYFRKVLQKAYAASQYRIRYLYDFSREDLYHHFSTHFPEFVQRVPQYMLASYLGFTPEYLSQIRKNYS